MRIGAMVLLREGVAVQSYGWQLVRGLGRLQGVLDALDDYGCDEIAVIRPVRDSDTDTALAEDIHQLGQCSTMTPLSFGGGIRCAKQLSLLQELPVERLVLSSAVLKGERELIEQASQSFGKQAIQCLLPVRRHRQKIEVFCPAHGCFQPLSGQTLELIDALCNELILVDTTHEGVPNSFDFALLEALSFPRERTLLSGGIGTKTVAKAADSGVAAVLLDNRMLHREYATEAYRRG